MKRTFESWNPRGETLQRVERCIEIVEEYQAQGLVLTLRQLYYQHVTRGFIPNTDRSYKNLGSLVSRMRLAGLLDWDAIEDRGRQPDVPTEFRDLGHLVDVAERSYRLDRWATQKTYVELWVEKAALAGVLEPLARQWHVTLMVNKGYSSQSAMFESAKRFVQGMYGPGSLALRPTRAGALLYLGDHDPSGEDMVRDIRDRLSKFMRGLAGRTDTLRVHKVALTMDQIEQYDPPPNPAKLSDSRASKYVKEHGDSSWEVDALEPRVLQQIITSHLEQIVDAKKMAAVVQREKADKAKLRKALSAIDGGE